MRTVTGGHFGDDVLIDLLDGVASADASAHAASCLHCRARLDEAASGLELARSADIPEPSPLFWQSFRSQVDRRIESGDRPPVWSRFAAVPWLTAAAALAIAVAVLLPRGKAPAPAPAPSAVLPAWSALPPADEDPGLELLAAVVPGTSGLGPLVECQGLGDCIAEAAALSEEETATLTEALQRELGRES